MELGLSGIRLYNRLLKQIFKRKCNNNVVIDLSLSFNVTSVNKINVMNKYHVELLKAGG